MWFSCDFEEMVINIQDAIKRIDLYKKVPLVRDECRYRRKASIK